MRLGDDRVSSLPSQMVNRWENRSEPKPGQGRLYWHILFNDEPHVQQLAALAQEKLTPFRGLHLTPKQWLHLTVMIAGFAEDFTDSDMEEMVARAHQSLSDMPAITVSFGRVLYHPEAILLGIRPSGALDLMFHAIREATCNTVGAACEAQHAWFPHVTLAYSTAVQPAEPIIAALGHELPECEVQIRRVNLVVQEGPERLWNWHSLTEVPLGNPSVLPVVSQIA